MHVLTVLDHPNPKSFTAAIAHEFMLGARSAGHETELADLNAEGFDPRWTMADIESREPETAPRDVRAEQDRISRADAIAFVFPLFWWGMPATMKGWIDRVWSWGWAYDQLENTEDSLQKPRTGLLLVPAGARSDEMDAEGYASSLRNLWIQGTFGYFGFKKRELVILNGSKGSVQRRKALLERARDLGRRISIPDEC